MTRAAKSSVERKDDPEEMRVAIRSIKAAGLPLQRCSEHQLKSGVFNFWPATGRISADQQGKLPERGLDAFIALVSKDRDERLGIVSVTLKI